jgi:putative transposase
LKETLRVFQTLRVFLEIIATMTSPGALLYDAYYHIYNRGVNRENIFIEERNYRYFINLYLKYIGPVADTFAYCLLRNHFHLLVRIKSEEEILLYETPRVCPANAQNKSQDTGAGNETGGERKPLGSHYPSIQFSNFLNAYAKGINKAYGRTGSLFQHPFGRVPVGDDRQFWNVVAYIHQNPEKHKLTEDFSNWPYSSYGIHLSKSSTPLRRDMVLDWFGGHEKYRALHETRIAERDSRQFAQDDED